MNLLCIKYARYCVSLYISHSALRMGTKWGFTGSCLTSAQAFFSQHLLLETEDTA